MDPATAALVAAAIGGASILGGQAMNSANQKKAAKYRAKETKRETYAQLVQDALQREAELEAQRLKSGMKLGQRRSQELMNTSDLVRGAFKI